jgi:hypothetical protein
MENGPLFEWRERSQREGWFIRGTRDDLGGTAPGTRPRRANGFLRHLKVLSADGALEGEGIHKSRGDTHADDVGENPNGKAGI